MLDSREVEQDVVVLCCCSLLTALRGFSTVLQPSLFDCLIEAL